MARGGIDITDEDLAVIANALSSKLEQLADDARDGRKWAVEQSSEVSRALGKISGYAEEHDIQLYGRRRRNPSGAQFLLDDLVTYRGKDYEVVDISDDDKKLLLRYRTPDGVAAKWVPASDVKKRNPRGKRFGTGDQIVYNGHPGRVVGFDDDGNVMININGKAKWVPEDDLDRGAERNPADDHRNANGLTYAEWLQQSGQRNSSVRHFAWRRGEHPRDYRNQ